MKIKRMLAAVGTAAFIGGALVGCSSGSAEPGSGGGGGDESKGALAMSYAGGDQQFWNNVLLYMEPAATEAGYSLLTHDPQWNVQSQIDDWNAWAARGDLKALMAFPAQNDSVVEVTKQLVDQGIPVLGYASKWEGVENAVLVDAFEDGYQQGEATAQFMIDNGREGEPVALVSDLESDLGIDRNEGALKALTDLVPNAKVTVLPGLSQSQAFDSTKSYMVASPDTKIFVATGDDRAHGVYEALLDTGVASDDLDYLLTSLDASNPTLDILKEGGTFWQWAYGLSPEEFANTQLDMLIKAAEGEPVEDVVFISTLLTKDNLDSFYSGK